MIEDAFPPNHDDPEASCSGKSGSVLVAVLWCLALLSVVVIGVLHTSRMNLLVVKNYGDRVQAHYLAVAGIEKAKAVLYEDARQRSRTGLNHSGQLSDSAQQFRDVRFGRGEFRVFHRGRPDEGGGILFGASDEESRLNVNNASAEELGKLNAQTPSAMTPDVVAGIIDWRDEDNTVTPGGAESEFYLAMQPPYLPRNGPLQSIRELLGVRGVTPELLFGKDQQENGELDQEQDEGQTTATVNDMSDLGWAGLLTTHSTMNNVSGAGTDRVNVQSAEQDALTGVKGITEDIAKAIIASRGQNRFQSVADLLDVVAARNQNQPGQAGGPSVQPSASPGQDPSGPNPQPAQAQGPKVIDANLLMEIADDLTTDSGSDLPGLVNINTASLEVLTCLPGLSRELAQSIISFRQSNGFFPNIAGLLKVPGLSQDAFKQLAPRITARSETYRIQCEGKIQSTGVRQRIQEVVHIGLRNVTTLSYREDDL